MASEIQILNPFEVPNWNNLLASHDSASFFHTVEWARVLAEAYNYTPCYFTGFEDGRLKILVPMMEIKSFLTGKRGVSLPFTDDCPPILSEEIDPKQIFESISGFGKKRRWKTTEFRSGNAGFLKNEASFVSFKFHNLKLKINPGDILAGFRRSTRQNIKKAENEGLQITMSNSWEPYKEFLRLNWMTRKKHGLPPQPNSFFQSVFNHIISKNKGIIVLASHQSKIIAGAVFFHFGKEAIYKYGASDRGYQHLRPNNLVMWETIKHYAKNRFKSLSLGRTDLDNHGLMQFKRGWGTEEETLSYYKYDLKKNAFVSHQPKIRTSYNIFKMMPTPMLRLTGRLLYRHIG